MRDFDGIGLENRHRLDKSIVGSNPTPSAINDLREIEPPRIWRKARAEPRLSTAQESAQALYDLFAPHGARFWEKVQVKNDDVCWPWTAAKSAFGHGRFKIAGKLYSSHRIAYVLSGGSTRSGPVIMHSCDNPSCCNPAHLSAGTMRENAQDMFAKGRQPPRQRSKIFETTPPEIIAAVRESACSHRNLANLFGLSERAIRRIKGRPV
jgi:hypothetical protein